MLKDIVKNPEEQSVRGPSEAKHERDGQSPKDVGQLAEAGNGSSKMVFAQRSHAKDIVPQAWSPSDHFDGKRFFNPTLPKDFAPSQWIRQVVNAEHPRDEEMASAGIVSAPRENTQES
jgi:hypothetical protein